MTGEEALQVHRAWVQQVREQTQKQTLVSIALLNDALDRLEDALGALAVAASTLDEVHRAMQTVNELRSQQESRHE